MLVKDDDGYLAMEVLFAQEYCCIIDCMLMMFTTHR